MAKKVKAANTVSITTAIALAVLFGGGYRSAVSAGEKAGKEAADAGAAKLMLDMELVKEQLKAHEQRFNVIDQHQKEQSSDLHELALDVREQYRAEKTGARSWRLERPPAAHDGGTP